MGGDGGSSTTTRAEVRIEARAPTRIDFGGGWTDVPPYPEREGGFVCNLAIARCASVSLTTHDGDHVVIEDQGMRWEGTDLWGADGPALAKAALRRGDVGGVELVMKSDFPSGAGLGGSSAAGVALASAIGRCRGLSLAPAELAEWSRTVEVDELGVAGGRQDHYASAFGGALALTFAAQVEPRRIPLPPSLAEQLERRCVIAYTGESRISGETISAVIDAFTSGVPHVVSALARMRSLAQSMAGALERADIDELGRLVGEHWELQRSLHPRITTNAIDQLISAGRSSGSLGAKALGASGGGCVLLIAEDGRSDELRAAVEPLATLLPFAVDHAGVQVRTLPPMAT
jgi:D-glycero-alpha-D-manno-heptose-7-phosphate kinase